MQEHNYGPLRITRFKGKYPEYIIGLHFHVGAWRFGASVRGGKQFRLTDRPKAGWLAIDPVELDSLK